MWEQPARELISSRTDSGNWGPLTTRAVRATRRKDLSRYREPDTNGIEGDMATVVDRWVED